MLLAEVLKRLWIESNPTRIHNPESHARLQAPLFADRIAAPFGIHAIVRRGAEEYHVDAGQWYGPNSICLVLRDLTAELPNADVKVPAVVVAKDGVVYRSEIETACAPTASLNFDAATDDADPLLRRPPSPRPATWMQPLLLLVPLRLGLNRISDEYIQVIRDILHWPQSVGFIGGTRARSMYFVGCHGENAFVLDPHQVQPALLNGHQWRSMYADPTVLTMKLTDLAPSIAFGFLCHTRDDYEHFQHCTADMIRTRGNHALFTIQDRVAQNAYSSACDIATDEENEDEEDTYVLIQRP